MIGAAGTFSNLGLSILLTFSASFVRHVNVKINKGEPEHTLQVRSKTNSTRLAFNSGRVTQECEKNLLSKYKVIFLKNYKSYDKTL